jgi:hypothetical protein
MGFSHPMTEPLPTQLFDLSQPPLRQKNTPYQQTICHYSLFQRTQIVAGHFSSNPLLIFLVLPKEAIYDK